MVHGEEILIKPPCFFCSKTSKHFIDGIWRCGNHKKSKGLRPEVVAQKLGTTLDITNKECDLSFAQNRPCNACSMCSGKVIRHTLEDINTAELKREKLLAQMEEKEKNAI